jgi:hypothetical protein
MVRMSDELKERNILKLILIVRFVCATLDVGHPRVGAFHDAPSGTLRDAIQSCSVPERSLDFLPFSPPDVFSIDIHSFDTFPFPDPLLRSNA